MPRRSGLDSPTAPGAAPRAKALGLALVVAATLGVALARSAHAEVPRGVITEIVIEGLESIDREKVLAKLDSRVGRELDDRTIEHDLNTLAKTGWFSGNVAPFTKVDKPRGGFVLIFTVQEMPVLRQVEYRGMTVLKVKDVEQNTGLKVGARADHVKTQMAVGSITRMYQEKGYEFAQVRLLEGAKPGSRKAIFEVFEGPKCLVTGVSFEGNAYASSAMLETKVKTRPKLLGAWPSKFHRDELEADVKALKDYYDGQGFFEVKITPVTRQEKPGDVHVTFVISEGVQYKVRGLIFEGNQQIATNVLMDGMKLQKGQPFAETVRLADEKALQNKYGAIGCIDAKINYDKKYTEEPGVVDLVYTIEEGAPYSLGRILVVGNDRTQDRVIRREFNQAGLVPGEPLDANRMELAKKRLGNLRYFVMDPQQGKPLNLELTNRRPADRPYGTNALTQKVEDSVTRTRLQSPSDPPASGETRLARRQDTPLAPGDGPAAIPLEEPPDDYQIPAPAPSAGPGLSPPGAAPMVEAPQPGGPPGTPTPPLGSREPKATFPSIPGMNQTDVGPGRNEPFANRDFADIITSVDEGSTGRLMLGVGVSSYNGLNGTLVIQESNFDYKAIPRTRDELFGGGAFRGAGQDLRIELSPGTLVNRAQISFRNPYLFDMPIGFGASAYTFRRFYSDYTEDRTGFRPSLGKQFGLRTYADVAFRIEDVNFHGFRYPAPAAFLAANGHTTLATIRPSIRFDNRNDPFAATAGQYLEFAFEQGWGNFTFPKLTAEGRQYFTLGSRPDGSGKRFVTARGFFGVTGRDTPVYERFFAGDFRSMRGFSYRGVGPRELGVNVGGVMEALGSIEYQFPWTANDKLQQVIFCDFGTVESGYNFTQFRAAVGTGLRIYLPPSMFGPLPLAFDLAVPVSKAEDDRTRLFTFFIGAFW